MLSNEFNILDWLFKERIAGDSAFFRALSLFEISELLMEGIKKKLDETTRIIKKKKLFFCRRDILFM